jgi:hypothetical protein
MESTIPELLSAFSAQSFECIFHNEVYRKEVLMQISKASTFFYCEYEFQMVICNGFI